MWILVRVGVAVIALVARVRHAVFRPMRRGDSHGIPSYVRKGYRKGEVVRLDLGLALAGPVVFRLTRESRIDRFFKRIGACDEIQAGDSRFDPKVFVACDHPFLAELLRGNRTARQEILKIFQAGFDRIWTEGHVLWIRTRQHRETSNELWRLLFQLRSSVQAVESQLPHRYRDPFVWKALFVEALIWSVAGYAIGAVLENYVITHDYHRDPFAVVRLGLVVASILFGVLLLLIRMVLQRSSRGHRILVESTAILALSLPVAGGQLVSDLNRGLDRAPASYDVRTIQRTDLRHHRRGGTTYHLHLVSNGRPPNQIQVERSVYDRAGPKKELLIVWGPGRLGLPWYRELKVR